MTSTNILINTVKRNSANIENIQLRLKSMSEQLSTKNKDIDDALTYINELQGDDVYLTTAIDKIYETLYDSPPEDLDYSVDGNTITVQTLPSGDITTSPMIELLATTYIDSTPYDFIVTIKLNGSSWEIVNQYTKPLSSNELTPITVDTTVSAEGPVYIDHYHTDMSDTKPFANNINAVSSDGRKWSIGTKRNVVNIYKYTDSNFRTMYTTLLESTICSQTIDSSSNLLNVNSNGVVNFVNMNDNTYSKYTQSIQSNDTLNASTVLTTNKFAVTGVDQTYIINYSNGEATLQTTIAATNMKYIPTISNGTYMFSIFNSTLSVHRISDMTETGTVETSQPATTLLYDDEYNIVMAVSSLYINFIGIDSSGVPTILSTIQETNTIYTPKYDDTTHIIGYNASGVMTCYKIASTGTTTELPLDTDVRLSGTLPLMCLVNNGMFAVLHKPDTTSDSDYDVKFLKYDQQVNKMTLTYHEEYDTPMSSIYSYGNVVFVNPFIDTLRTSVPVPYVYDVNDTATLISKVSDVPFKGETLAVVNGVVNGVPNFLVTYDSIDGYDVTQFGVTRGNDIKITLPPEHEYTNIEVLRSVI